ncbi:hypothetical protein G4X40_08670 [Rhodococcus sp. D2-41]|uniref:Uncharacterized protein n=1 Tax=Speluncibacter jeojiensis TaxID=2710754 RepID=A0A9X4M7K6_9ACTN|nr:hypothetical protein [Rhodococcus sp. D2-41]MDG3010223.1 hypothetical protein [Rhodococcus sp. D2-41]MDG3015736.1 hypothetical protein [Corynebacteriales bacterium D3-21]
MTAFFLGGAAGSALTAAARIRGGRAGVSALGSALALTTFAVWVAERASAARTA